MFDDVSDILVGAFKVEVGVRSWVRERINIEDAI